MTRGSGTRCRGRGKSSRGEILVSDRALAGLEQDALKVRKKRFFRVKGVPKDVAANAVQRVG